MNLGERFFNSFYEKNLIKYKLNIYKKEKENSFTQIHHVAIQTALQEGWQQVNAKISVHSNSRMACINPHK